jgi:hypothetical protein
MGNRETVVIAYKDINEKEIGEYEARSSVYWRRGLVTAGLELEWQWKETNQPVRIPRGTIRCERALVRIWGRGVVKKHEGYERSRPGRGPVN